MTPDIATEYINEMEERRQALYPSDELELSRKERRALEAEERRARRQNHRKNNRSR